MLNQTANGIERAAEGQRISLRERKAIESFRNAVSTIGTIVHGYSLFGITRGQFSMIDLILACLDQAGPSRVTLWTWCIAEYEVQCFERLMMDERVTTALLVIDAGAQGRARESDQKPLRTWRKKNGPESVRWVRNHAKIATVESAKFKLLLRGSMNLNYNPRFEQFDIDEGGPGFDLVQKIENGLPMLKDDCLFAEYAKASKLDQAWTADQFKPFETLKTWAK